MSKELYLLRLKMCAWFGQNTLLSYIINWTSQKNRATQSELFAEGFTSCSSLVASWSRAGGGDFCSRTVHKSNSARLPPRCPQMPTEPEKAPWWSRWLGGIWERARSTSPLPLVAVWSTKVPLFLRVQIVLTLLSTTNRSIFLTKWYIQRTKFTHFNQVVSP